MPLRDLEQIQHDVIEPRSKTLLLEVIKCYEGGAYRAALVSLWIAVVADLTSKIRYLAESGDGKAAEVVSRLDEALANQTVSKVQDYERKILNIAEKELEIILPREKKELERLNEDRNLCAHPGYVNEAELFVPDAEVVRAHLVAATRAVFAQRPLAGKRLLERLENEIESESWPEESEYFLDRFFRPARETVKANTAKILIKNSLQSSHASDRVARRSRESVYTVAAEAPSLFEECLHSVLHTWEESASLGDTELIRAVGAYGSRSIFWSALPGTSKSRLMALLDNCELDILLNEGFFSCGAPVEPNAATSFGKIISKLNTDQMDQAITQSTDLRPFVRPAIAHVKSSSTFRNAEANLRLVEKCSEVLNPEDVTHLREAIEGNAQDQVRLADGTEAILISIYSGSSASVKAHHDWSALAMWLHKKGTEKNDQHFLYNAFKELINANK